MGGLGGLQNASLTASDEICQGMQTCPLETVTKVTKVNSSPLPTASNREARGIQFTLKTGNIHTQIMPKCPDLTVPEVSCSFPSQRKHRRSQYQAKTGI